MRLRVYVVNLGVSFQKLTKGTNSPKDEVIYRGRRSYLPPVRIARRRLSSLLFLRPTLRRPFGCLRR